jgi:hypothetical protein
MSRTASSRLRVLLSVRLQSNALPLCEGTTPTSAVIPQPPYRPKRVFDWISAG